jgi:hypothetical protein
MNTDIDVNIQKRTDLEEYVMKSGDAEFPAILTSDRGNTKSYPERYNDFKTRLGKEQDNVEYENTLSSFHDELNKQISYESKDLSAINEIYNNIIVLNRHGKGHIELVIKHASSMIKYIENYEEKWRIKPFEVFILLCAIQVHDLGNKYGREEHSTSFYNDFIRYANESLITSSALQRCIFSIARAHGGKIEGDKDTIEKAQLQKKAPVDNIDIRQQFLAAILRFSDELADDQTRAKDIKNMPEFSKLYHAYSATLHTARIVINDINNTYIIELCYYLTQNEAVKLFKKIDKNGKIKEVKLLDEIFNRTIKMERERRYCSRYLYPYLQINEIIVRIDILTSTFETYPIQYTLPAKGYPNEDICVPDRDKFINHIMGKTSQEGMNTNE